MGLHTNLIEFYFLLVQIVAQKYVYRYFQDYQKILITQTVCKKLFYINFQTDSEIISISSHKHSGIKSKLSLKFNQFYQKFFCRITKFLSIINIYLFGKKINFYSLCSVIYIYCLLKNNYSF